ncbi:Rrf2 family transcriptional regulator [Granulosicoccus antarcticus]|uniref:HTH-type transcriptional repressor NsrR n=1 Tax=Granulosicoccus antarcticus IMCC3135 TaxID=1192854 RepID=A0A2Z2NTH1_9GAMM|nr:Rrf2 family transcriptional regulator [Granulosicoccus antarcticus]ASJ73815.1 HTH-type transcriptional repressor NsrR [Granulosicoccus antarcticus IMCC3135]
MRLTDASDIAFRVLIYAAEKEGALFRIEEVVEFYGISRSTTMKVVNALTRAGLLVAIRGRSGGLRLGKETGEIPLGDVVRLMEPDFAVVECLRPVNTCPITPICALPAPLIAATNAFLDTLDRYTLADMAIGPKRMFPLTYQPRS